MELWSLTGKCSKNCSSFFINKIFRSIKVKIGAKKKLGKKIINLPLIGGGSTTVDGPKNDGISLDVVTGVFKSPVCASETVCDSSIDDCVSVITVSPTFVNKLRWGWQLLLLFVDVVFDCSTDC